LKKPFKKTTLFVMAALATLCAAAAAQPPFQGAVIKSLSGDVALRVAGSDWFPAHEGTTIDPGMEIRAADGATLEAVAARSLQMFWLGPAEGSVVKHRKPETDPAAPDIEITKGHLALSFSPAESGANLVVRTDAGLITLNPGLYSIIASGKDRPLKIAVSEGRACLKRPDAKAFCTDDKKMISYDPGSDKAPRSSAVENSLLNQWKRLDWSIVGLKPDIRVIQPQEGALFTDSNITIVGVTTKGATVKINNREVNVKPDGSFSSLVSLFEGENKINVTARGRGGKTATIIRSVSLDTTPPILTISQPPSNFDPTSVGSCDSQNYYIQIFGLTEPGVSLQANGVNVSRFIEDDGSFLIQDFPIRRSERTLIIEAEDMYRRRSREVFHILEPSDPSRCN